MMARAALNVFALTGSTMVLTYGVAIRTTEIAWKIDEPTARRLAAEAHYGGDKYLDAFDYDYTSTMSPPFFVFYGLNEPPAEGGFGYFAVNPWTGVV